MRISIQPATILLLSLSLLAACGDDSVGDGAADAATDTTADTSSDVGVDDVGDLEDAVDHADVTEVDVVPDVAADVVADVDLSALPREVGGDRPARVYFPRDYNPAQSYPLVILLHGYGATGQVQDIYLGVSSHVDEYGFVLVVPDGTLNSDGQRYWNATLACCSFGESDVDDVAYITSLVEETSEAFNIDSGRVYTFGHSNGGFMSYRLACDAPEVFTAIVSLAGATLSDAEACTPDGPAVSALQIHGTDDETIAYEGGEFGLIGTYPGAVETITFHAGLAGCDLDAVQVGDDLDIESGIDGLETGTQTWTEGCEPGSDFALWTMEGATHIPTIKRDGTPLALQWLLAHDRTP